MPNPRLATVLQLRTALARQPGASAAGLAAALGVSVPTLHRLLLQLQREADATPSSANPLISAGKARRTRYALARPLRGLQTILPVYQVDRTGSVQTLTRLTPLQPEGTSMDLAGMPWPVPEEARDGWWDGLPYPLYHMRPQGYMGRQFALAEHRRLAVSANPQEWGDDDILFVLSQSGADLSGNLIVGDAACEQWLAAKAAATEPVAEAGTGERYVQLAEQAIAAGVAGSSAAGEFPKFTTQRALAGSVTPHVLVKFSGTENASAAVRRWSDLLVCEHLALAHAATMPGIVSARSRVIAQGGRTFLEVERFDRHGDFGRSPLCALDVLNAALIGDGTMDWPHLTTRLAALDIVSADDVDRVRHLWWYGRLIANTDMHTGNLSFMPHKEGSDKSGRLTLAPLYDMLPMRYAPLAGGEVPSREFAPALPLPAEREAWRAACGAAIGFWREAAGDGRISEGFRGVCAVNGDEVERLREKD